MRFCDFFISYKIGLKGIKNIIPYTQLPLYRKLAIILIFIISLSGILLPFFYQSTPDPIMPIVMILFVIIFSFIDSKKENQEHMLQEHYAPYSMKRINMTIEILREYGIDYSDTSSIDSLISEAQTAQVDSDFFQPLKKTFQLFWVIIVPIVIYAVQKMIDGAIQNNTMETAIDVITISILFFLIAHVIASIIKILVYRDYNKYNDLIYDLRQIKIFHTANRSRF